MTYDDFLHRLEKVQRLGDDRAKACCPAHNDRNPSLSITRGDDDRVLLKCWAGCEALEVVHAMNLSLSDLFSQPTPHRGKPVSNRPRPNFREILKLIQHELQIVAICADVMRDGHELSERGQEALTRAYKNITKALATSNV